MILKPIPSDSTTYSTCGPGGNLTLQVSFDPPSILLERPEGPVQLCDRTWEYGFEAAFSPLILRFHCTQVGYQMLGTLSTADAEGSVTTTAMRGDGGDLVLTVPRPEPEFGADVSLLFKAVAVAPSRTAPSLVEGDIHPPLSSKPTLVIRPKKRCPTGIPKTTDDSAP